MRQRERHDEELFQGGAGAPEDGGADALEAFRSEANALLAAGDEAIDRVLSGNSERFLAANRQQGGQ